MVRSIWCGLSPRPTDSEPCGSKSTSSTLRPNSASAAPRLIVVVVLPTPPFWLHIEMTRALPWVNTGRGSGRSGIGRPVGPSTTSVSTSATSGTAWRLDDCDGLLDAGLLGDGLGRELQRLAVAREAAPDLRRSEPSGGSLMLSRRRIARTRWHRSWCSLLSPFAGPDPSPDQRPLIVDLPPSRGRDSMHLSHRSQAEGKRITTIIQIWGGDVGSASPWMHNYC